MNERGSRNVPPRSTEETEERQGGNKLTSPSHSPRAHEPDDAQPEIAPLDAKRIVREYIDAGGILDDLLADAPEGLTRTQRDQYAATKITRTAS